MKGALAFRILFDISSYPCEVLFFRELIILLISYVVLLFYLRVTMLKIMSQISHRIIIISSFYLRKVFD